jgi:hypothetical protein
MTRKLIELVDNQPLPNLISIRALRPDEVLFVDSRATRKVTKRLHNALKRDIHVHSLTLPDRYDPIDIFQRLDAKISDLSWGKKKIIVNVSGGNRPEAFAGYELAKHHDAVLADLEWVKKEWFVRLYRFAEDRAVLKSNVRLPGVITLPDYLNIHLPGYVEEGSITRKHGRTDEGGVFEKALYEAIAPKVDEILAGVRPKGVQNQIEIDLIIRRGNEVGIIEAKTGVNKAGIDQLSTAGAEDYLGEYLTKFLITGRRLTPAIRALAQAQQVRIIELPGYDFHRGIPDNERNFMLQVIRTAM